MPNLSEIERNGKGYAAALKRLGITSRALLLEAGATPGARKQLADVTGISPALITAWINRADLARIRGVGDDYARLLQSAGVDTVPALARRNSESLCRRLAEINQQRHLVGKLPNPEQVEHWIEQAKRLPRAVHY